MAVFIGAKKTKFQYGASKVKKIYRETTQVYLSGNVVTYNVDNVLYMQEYEEGQNVLNPTVVSPSKVDHTFKGWSKSPGGSVLSSLSMGGDPIALYAVFQRNPWYLVPLNSVTWNISKSYDSCKAVIGSNEIKVTADKDGGVAYAFCGASATIPTKGCTKCRIQFSFWHGYSEPESIGVGNGYGIQTMTGYSGKVGRGVRTYSYLNNLGNSVSIFIQAGDAADYSQYIGTIYEIYFYN